MSISGLGVVVAQAAAKRIARDQLQLGKGHDAIDFYFRCDLADRCENLARLVPRPANWQLRIALMVSSGD